MTRLFSFLSTFRASEAKPPEQTLADAPGVPVQGDADLMFTPFPVDDDEDGSDVSTEAVGGNTATPESTPTPRAPAAEGVDSRGSFDAERFAAAIANAMESRLQTALAAGDKGSAQAVTEVKPLTRAEAEEAYHKALQEDKDFDAIEVLANHVVEQRLEKIMQERVAPVLTSLTDERRVEKMQAKLASFYQRNPKVTEAQKRALAGMYLHQVHTKGRDVAERTFDFDKALSEVRGDTAEDVAEEQKSAAIKAAGGASNQRAVGSGTKKTNSKADIFSETAAVIRTRINPFNFPK